MHWPDHLTRGAGRARTLAKQLLFALLLIRLAAGRVTVVRTVHNRTPHEAGSPAERALHRRLEATTRAWIHLVPPEDGPPDPGVAVVPHGHYRSVYPPVRPLETATGTVLYFGYVRPYKGVARLCEQFRVLRRDDLRLRVVGRPIDARTAADVTAASDGDPRIDLVLRGVPPQDLAAEIEPRPWWCSRSRSCTTPGPSCSRSR
ncbi:hypothetical protein [Cellulosimicrobium sp. CUA-896]|uniref:hypothetical protein n=1 Tax=Cellulosimicrobium sp. CUA-896 TaxID=1517881 RepID=UPI00096A48E5|nr:hypothetical protein [Cellulosimicrobium sp. CUA-896]